MSGISIAGHIFRFAACQFGQKTAGSPLNALNTSHAFPTPYTWQPGLTICTFPCARQNTHHASATRADAPPAARRTTKPCSLRLSGGERPKPLTFPSRKGKDIPRPFTGVHIDTYTGRFSMLADKLAAMRSTFAALVNARHSTPRLLAQARGKAAHYGCAVQLLAAICPALTQAIHQAESAHCLPAPGPEEEASDSLFDWDQTIRLSTRTRSK
jgi:hypothetical protein